MKIGQEIPTNPSELTISRDTRAPEDGRVGRSACVFTGCELYSHFSRVFSKCYLPCLPAHDSISYLLVGVLL